MLITRKSQRQNQNQKEEGKDDRDNKIYKLYSKKYKNNSGNKDISVVD